MPTLSASDAKTAIAAASSGSNTVSTGEAAGIGLAAAATVPVVHDTVKAVNKASKEVAAKDKDVANATQDLKTALGNAPEPGQVSRAPMETRSNLQAQVKSGQDRLKQQQEVQAASQKSTISHISNTIAQVASGSTGHVAESSYGHAASVRAAGSEAEKKNT